MIAMHMGKKEMANICRIGILLQQCSNNAWAGIYQYLVIETKTAVVAVSADKRIG